MTAKLHFDGFGLNDAENRYKPRVATFTSDGYAKQWGSLLEAAPDMLAALQRFARAMEQRSYPELQGINCDAIAAIAKAKGK